MAMTETSPFLDEIARRRAAYALPPRAGAMADELAQGILGLLFPHFAEGSPWHGAGAKGEVARLRAVLAAFLASAGREGDAAAVPDAFLGRLPAIAEALDADARATADADPAARSVDEVILAYPGFRALAHHRVAHALLALDVPLLPRLVSEAAHRATGIDIHPGAAIGRATAIDHGTGIVIGETAVIGDRVRLYQGVTLGALSVEKGKAGRKRHPTIEDDVVIYANATILGGQTVVGRGSVIGGNVWLTHSVPPGSVVTSTEAVERRRPDDLHPLEFHI